MTNTILFSEEQRFNQWWIWLILLALNSIFVLGIYQQIYKGEPYGDNPMSNAGLLIVSAVMLIFTLFFFSIKLQTIIKAEGILVRFFPLQLKYRIYTWENLTRINIRQYNPIKEYGGWGIRLGLFGSGKALNVSGNMGLQLEFDAKTNLLIGTQKPEELKNILIELGKYTPNI